MAEGFPRPVEMVSLVGQSKLISACQLHFYLSKGNSNRGKRGRKKRKKKGRKHTIILDREHKVSNSLLVQPHIPTNDDVFFRLAKKEKGGKTIIIKKEMKNKIFK